MSRLIGFIVIVLPVSTILFLATSIAGTVLAARSPIEQPAPTVSDRFMPGNRLPDHAWCNWSDYVRSGREVLVCEALAGDHLTATMIFDPDQKIITHTSMQVAGPTIGELMLAWGQPDGCYCESAVVEVFWGTKSALLIQPFSPSSQVQVMSYSLRPQENPDSWRGFIVH